MIHFRWTNDPFMEEEKKVCTGFPPLCQGREPWNWFKQQWLMFLMSHRKVGIVFTLRKNNHLCFLDSIRLNPYCNALWGKKALLAQSIFKVPRPVKLHRDKASRIRIDLSQPVCPDHSLCEDLLIHFLWTSWVFPCYAYPANFEFSQGYW